MATAYPFALVTPEAVIFEGDVQSVSLRSGLGDIAFFAQHSPYIATVAPCVVKVLKVDGEILLVGVDGGFVRAAGNMVSVVVPFAELGYEDEESLLAAVQARTSAASDAVMDAPNVK
ncbi:MAG: F0F1 ATP synthase subunit epsilon [Acidimicrobiales bacterium]